MADTTNIEWCDSTFNPWIGCTRVSPACDDCYAARSTPARTLGVAWGAGQQRRRTSDANWKLPDQWQRQAAAFQAQHGRRRRVFCASLADWLDNEVPDGWLVDLLHLVHTTPDLDWLLLSKRIGNWRTQVTHAAGMAALAAGRRRWPGLAEWICDWLDGKPPRNVWLGSTVVDQNEVDRDVPKLLRVPARVRFLSVEPMLRPLDLEAVPFGAPCTGCGEPVHLDAFTGSTSCIYACDGPKFDGIDWVICGGESGPKARPVHPDWPRSLRDQCAAAGVPFLFKQWGEFTAGEPVSDRCGDGDASAWRRDQRGQHWHDPTEAGKPLPQLPPVKFLKVGKKAAGRQLDGRTHDAWPEGRT